LLIFINCSKVGLFLKFLKYSNIKIFISKKDSNLKKVQIWEKKVQKNSTAINTKNLKTHENNEKPVKRMNHKRPAKTTEKRWKLGCYRR
jgi:hypothetical protein